MTSTKTHQLPSDLNPTEFLPSTASQFPGAGDVVNLISQSNKKVYPVRVSPSKPTGSTMNMVSLNNPSVSIAEGSNLEDSSGPAVVQIPASYPPVADVVAVDMIEEIEAQGDHGANLPFDSANGHRVESPLRNRQCMMSNWLVLLWMVLFSDIIFFVCYFESNVKQFIEQHAYVSLISVIVCISLTIALEFTLKLRNTNPFVWILNIALVVSIGIWTGSGVLIYDIQTALMAKCWVFTILLLFFSLPKKNYEYSIVRDVEIVFALVATVVIVFLAVQLHRKTSFVLIGVTGVALALMSLSLVNEYYMKRDFKHVHKLFYLLEGVFYPLIALYLYLINSNG